MVSTKQFNQHCVAVRTDLLSLSQYAVDVISRNKLKPSVHNKFKYLYGSVSCLLWQVKVIVANEMLYITVKLAQISPMSGAALLLKLPATGVQGWEIGKRCVEVSVFQSFKSKIV